MDEPQNNDHISSSEEEEDDNEIELGRSETTQQPGIAVKSAPSNQTTESFEEMSSKIAGDDVLMKFTLPDGTSYQSSVFFCIPFIFSSNKAKM